MTGPDSTPADLRDGLIAGLRAARATERAIFAAYEPTERDAPAADGGWSPKDVLAHLGAWRRHQADRLAARREGRDEAAFPAGETDEINAVLHAERAGWSWDRVLADTTAATELLIVEIEVAADETLANDRMVGSIMGNGPEHDLAHLPALAARVGLEERIAALAGDVAAAVDSGGLPTRAAAYARYNLACFHALAGRLDEARALLRVALPASDELRAFAPDDGDLVALRDELPDLMGG